MSESFLQFTLRALRARTRLMNDGSAGAVARDAAAAGHRVVRRGGVDGMARGVVAEALRRSEFAAGVRRRLRGEARRGEASARRDRVNKTIKAMAADSQVTPVVRRLFCLRGVSTLTGFALAVEVGDWDRFTSSTIGAYPWLMPSEHSGRRGRSPRQGTPMPASRWSRRHGTTARSTAAPA